MFAGNRHIQRPRAEIDNTDSLISREVYHGLRVDVEHQSLQVSREYSSSSEYSSTPSSPMGLHAREESSDSAEENDRRAEIHKEFSEKEKTAVLLNHYTTSVRPTAQVLPVQNDTASTCASHNSMPVQGAAASSNIAPSRLLNSMQRSEKGNAEIKLPTGSCTFIHSSGSLEEKNKTSFTSIGSRNNFKAEKGKLTVDAMPPSYQPLSVFSSIHESNVCPTSAVKGGYASTLERFKTAAQPSMAVESGSVTTVTSNSAFHMSPSPFKITVSSSVSNSSITGHRTYSSTTHASAPPPVIAARGTPYLTSAKVTLPAVSSMPMHSIPGTFCSNSGNNPSSCHPSSFSNPPTMHICPIPSSSPALSSVTDNTCYNSSSSAVTVQNQNHQPGCGVCSSCGCSGSCGSSPTPLNYATYLHSHFSVPSVLQIPLLPFPPLCNSGYINSSPAFPVVHPSYNNGLPSESVLSGQSGFIMPQVQTFLGGTTGGYQVTGLMGNALGSSHKRNGNISCYNCGAVGHRALDCKMPPADSGQQGNTLAYHTKPEVR
ncbi:zinc finger CCHC domain-containing protein 14-like [Protopterus annectens]|uniref:zinc finger CCHC domain-containing protein 14-like n=1 Tax=Protopterus annectens TaxID=7888 RepID=UPI001CF95BF3|nr:zinc finger CCHC domain-containing protein 14-like [Protopterus annectens]